jgi:predicted nucleotidyltransferase
MERPLTGYRFVREIAALSCVDAIWLFGSRARGYARARSDIDLAVLCPRATREDWSQVLDIAEEVDTLLEIDCVRFDALPEDSELRAAIQRTHQVIFERLDA